MLTGLALTKPKSKPTEDLQASGTTLGADNGIGVCAALALLDAPQAAKLPPLECLFTVDEETGLTGAFQLDASMLSGARRGLLEACMYPWRIQHQSSWRV